MSNTITMSTNQGDAEATRDDDGIWVINYPWGADRFHGPKGEAAARMRKAIKQQTLADMTEYMTDAEMYAIEGMDFDKAKQELEAKFGRERVEQLMAIAG